MGDGNNGKRGEEEKKKKAAEMRNVLVRCWDLFLPYSTSLPTGSIGLRWSVRRLDWVSSFMYTAHGCGCLGDTWTWYMDAHERRFQTLPRTGPLGGFGFQ